MRRLPYSTIVTQFFLFCSFSVSRRCHFGYGGKKVSAGELDLPEVEITIPVKCQILYHNLSFCREKFWQVPWSLRLSPRLACSISFDGRVMGRVEIHSRKVGKAHSIVGLRLKNPTKQGKAHSIVGLRLKTSTIRLRRRKKKDRSE